MRIGKLLSAIAATACLLAGAVSGSALATERKAPLQPYQGPPGYVVTHFETVGGNVALMKMTNDRYRLQLVSGWTGGLDGFTDVLTIHALNVPNGKGTMLLVKGPTDNCPTFTYKGVMFDSNGFMDEKWFPGCGDEYSFEKRWTGDGYTIVKVGDSEYLPWHYMGDMITH